jgi:hypothetical protein
VSERRYRVVFRNAKGERAEFIVHAVSEADALLAAKQQLKRTRPQFVSVASAAVPTEE